MVKTIAYFLVILILFVSCQQDKGRIITVTGVIEIKEMGITLPHEHIMVDFIGADSTGQHRWNREEVVEKVLPYLKEVKGLGIRTLVECTPAYLGRDPLLLKELAKKSGLNILTNTGFYGAVENKFLPEKVFDMTVEELASVWIKEFTNGIEETGIRPGFIKIAVARQDTLTTVHEKLVRAAARTHLATGLTIVSHTGPAAPARQQLKVLEQEGVAPVAFIWTHAQHASPDEHIELAKTGAWVSLDNARTDSSRVQSLVDNLIYLKDNHVLDRVLISHDAGWYSVGEPGGGDFRPYTAILDKVVPALQQNGFEDSDIHQLMVTNPAKAFTCAVRTVK